MKKRINLLCLALTSAVCFLMAIVLSFGANVAFANSAFSLNEGFQIRTEAPDGLRVQVNVAEKIEGAQYGTLMLPEKMVEGGIALAFNEDLTLNENILDISTIQFNSDGKSYNSVLAAARVDGENQAFPESFYNTAITVRGYCINEGVVTYTSNTVTRSLAYVVGSYYVNGGFADANPDSILFKVYDTENSVDKLAKEIIIDQAQIVVGTNATAKLMIGNVDATASDKVSVTFSGNNDEVATVSADGTITPVKGGELTLTATFSGTTAGVENTIIVTKDITVYKEIKTVATVYDYGIKNAEALTLSSSDLSTEPQSVTLDGAAVTFDGYALDLTEAITTVGEKTLTVLTTDYTLATVKVNAVTGVIDSTADFLNMIGDWGNAGTYVQTADIDFEGAEVACSGGISGLYYDGRGHSISNVLTNAMFGRTYYSGMIKNLAVLNLSVKNATHTSGLVQSITGGSMENIYVSGGFAGGAAQNGIISREYVIGGTGKLNNILVDVVSTSATGTEKTVITRVNSEKDVEPTSIPKGITNVYSIGYPAKHLTYTGSNPSNASWGYDKTISYATGGYADGAAFLADKDTIFASGASMTTAFSLDKDAINNTVLKFYGKTVKCFYDGDVSYTFGYKNQDLVLPAEDFNGAVTGIKVNDAAVEFTTNADGDYVVAATNFSAIGIYGFEITTANETVYKNVEVVTAIIMTAEDLDNMDVWGRPSTFDETKLGTTGTLYKYSGKFLLGADIDYAGNTYTQECYVGANGYVSGAGAYWNGLQFDGQGYKIDNIHFGAHYASLFGMWLTDSTVKNLAVTNVSFDCGAGDTATNYMSTIARDLLGTSVLENVYVQGDIVSAGAGSASDISFVVLNKDLTTTMKNVIVDFNATLSIGKTCGIVKFGDQYGSGNTTDNLVNITNCYTIGSIKNICFRIDGTAVTVGGKSYTWAFVPIEGSTWGYVDEAAFLEAYNANNAMIDSNVFAVADESGATVLQFYNTALGQFRTVKTLAESAS